MRRDSGFWFSSFRGFVMVFMFGVAAFPSRAAAEDAAPRFQQRWFYASHNLLVDKNADTLIGLIERAGKSGYNGVVLADYKFNILGKMPLHYFQNVARVQKAAEAAKIEIIPTLFPIGYSAGLLAHDPNLAEGVPVKEAPFVVKGAQVTLVPDPAARLLNGDLEDVKDDRFARFSFQDDPGRRTIADHEVFHGGKVSCRMQDGPSVNCRLSQRVKVRPHACYRLSAWVKTRDLQLKGEFKLVALGVARASRPLSFFDQHLKPTQDWTQVDVTFNSFEETELQIMAGIWGSQSGTLWIDDLQLDELALVNVLRRDGCPLVVASADGTIYEEGKDYLAVRDDKLGGVPNRGDYSYRHPGPVLRLTDNSRIQDGQKLKVSWYHPILTHEYQVMCCLSDPKVHEQLRDQAKRVNDLLKPTTLFMAHDEIRVAGWCQACERSGKTPGALLAANLARCVEIIKEVNPKAKIVVWSDMFDPNHNAVDNYYLCNGTMAESWKGLPADVIVANWNGGKAAASLKWFAERGNAQVIAGYYDGGLDNFKKWTAAAKGLPKVNGFMYTTWQNKYDLLEEYGKAMLGKE
jgi:hypothetical protein